MDISATMRTVNSLGTARINYDELCTLTDTALHHRTENWMALGGIRTDHHDDVGLENGIKMLTRSPGTHSGG